MPSRIVLKGICVPGGDGGGSNSPSNSVRTSTSTSISSHFLVNKLVDWRTKYINIASLFLSPGTLVEFRVAIRTFVARSCFAGFKTSRTSLYLIKQRERVLFRHLYFYRFLRGTIPRPAVLYLPNCRNHASPYKNIYCTTYIFFLLSTIFQGATYFTI